MEAGSVCPSVTLSCPNGTVDLHTGQAVASYTAIATGSLSCAGALLIMYAYFAFKDLRTSAQTVITLLAVADLTVSIMSIVAGINYFVFHGETDQQKCQVYDILCTIQASVLMWSVWSVFIWNSALALHFCLLLFHRVTLANRLILVYNIVGWGLPIAVALPLLVLGKLGKNSGQPEPLCFIRVTPQSSAAELAVLLAFSQWIPEIISYFLVVILYGIITVRICRKRIQGHITSSAVQDAERRLLLIPFFYLAIHIWDTVLFAVVLAFPSDFCSDTPAQLAVYDGSNTIQVFANGFQGFLNSILYIFASKEMRRRLFYLPLARIAAKFRTKVTREQQQWRPRSPLIAQGEHHNEPPPGDGATNTYFSIPAEFPHSSHEEHNREQHCQPHLQSEMDSFAAARLRVEWSCTYLSLPSESFNSRVRDNNTEFAVLSLPIESATQPSAQSTCRHDAIRSYHSTEIREQLPECTSPQHFELEQSFTYFSLPSEFSSEMKPSEDDLANLSL